MKLAQLLLTAIAVFLLGLALLAGIASLSGCTAGWNDPPPNVVTPSNPCGSQYFRCGNGMCCRHGYLCRPGYCAWAGLEPTQWGATADGGVPERLPLLTPEEVRGLGR